MNFIAPRAEPLIRKIPLSSLALAPENVRRTPSDARADAELKASIAALGLLENLVVRADGPEEQDGAERYAVVAGGRRLKAMQALVEDKVLDPGHPVPCLVKSTEVEPAELSLAENVVRIAMHPAGLAALDAFEAGPWGEKYPAIAQSWRRNWEHVSPFFVFPKAVRRIVYTTNAIESLNANIRRAVRTRGHFPSDEAASKLLYLVLDHAAEAWKRPPREWYQAKTQFAVIFGERFINV